MKRKFGRHLTMKQKKFLDLFTAGLIRQARNAPWGHNLNFNIDDYPQLQNHLNDIHCYENMPVDAERYVNDKLNNLVFSKEDIDKFATDEEKEFLKESLADQRSMAYIDSVGGDLDKWEQFVQKMNPRDRKEAAFELKSAISGINHYIEHWTIPGGHRREKQEKRELYRKYLKVLEKVAGVGSGGEFKIEPEDYKEDIDKFATAEEKEFLKENWQGRLQKQYENFEEFEQFDEFYGLAEKLGYDSAKEAWEANPVVSGSVNPEDYHKVREDKDDWRKSWAKDQIEKLNQKRIKLQHSSITKEKEAEIKQIYSDMAELKNTIKESKNEKGKTRPVEYPYEIYTGFGPLADWEWRVLKHYQSPEKERENPYARVFCSVSSPMTQGDADMGDVYCKDIPGYKYDDKPDFSKTIDTQRLKNLSNKEMDMLADMFKIKK